MRSRIYIASFLLIVLSVSGFVPAALFAQTTPTATTAAQQAALQAELDALTAQINEYTQKLTTQKTQTDSLQRDVSILDNQISQAQLEIKAKQIAIQLLNKNIDTKTTTIQSLGDQVQEGKDSLAQLIRETEYLDNFSLPEIVFSDQDISQFLQDLDSYYFIKQSLNQTLVSMQQNQADTETERTNLSTQRDAQVDAEQAIQTAQDLIKKAEAQKNMLLSLSKAQQANYQNTIASQQKKADAIRAALFALRGTAAIPFGTALQYAQEASAKTSVDPAFILGILTQESDLGENVGSCNRPGDPPSKSWKVIMKPDRDQQPFLQITSALGLDPNTMPVSCPIGSGWGGAMGPSQFIPSTWLIYSSRIQAATGGGYPNPWSPRDAIMATAIYLEDLGAGGGSYTAEKTAALKYYAGGNWYKAANQFYGNDVMAKTASIQQNMIDPLENNP